MQRFLIGIGLLILVLGLLYPWLDKLGLGRLPGDLTFKSERMLVSFPIVTCIVLSLALSGILWLVRRF